MQTIIIPGAGEANIDTMVDNPFERANQRREKEVHSLLDKLPPATIGLKSVIGTLGEAKEEVKNRKRRFMELKPLEGGEEDLEKELLVGDEDDALEKRKEQMAAREEERKRERKKGMRKFRLKHKNIKTMERELLREKIESMKKNKVKKNEEEEERDDSREKPAAFGLFLKKKKVT